MRIEEKEDLKLLEYIKIKDWENIPRYVLDISEKLYNLFDRSTLYNIRKGKEKPSVWRRVISALTVDEAETALEVAFTWATEDSVSDARFPEKKENKSLNEKIIQLKENRIILDQLKYFQSQAVDAVYEPDRSKKYSRIKTIKVNVFELLSQETRNMNPFDAWDFADSFKREINNPVILDAIEKFKDSLKHSIDLRR